MTKREYLGAVVLLSALSVSVASLGWSDEDEPWEHDHGFWHRSAGVEPASDPTYRNECSACHFAYPAGLLPERSWVQLMRRLDDHFGENAELDEDTRKKIENYLRGHAAEHVPNRFSRSMLRSLSEGETPLRITETPFFRYKHREIPPRMVQKNPKVRSFANCASCHTMADRGIYDEDTVRIPGFGQWDD